ncbi:hypothetical protein HNP82_002147 [Catenibacillus scindens]|uniref:DUF3793 family protein n=1 Tax=Catenibacillus scindens TaxID=673271 RepID=A0A7W8HBM1_9FIRM|nr:DUF3793 family protein [Catenibacillus scindens]MBB5265008.1 hypothetical protein [Catenibacillus scindens]
MSEDVFQIITHKDIKALKMQLALQCSPVLAGLKVSNLLIVSSKDENHIRRLFRKSCIEARLICRTETKATFLLYRRDELEAYLRQSRVLALLLWLGYDKTCLEDVLDLFCRRYTDYCQQKKDFPHEMGLILGYPAADVYGFIINKGKNDLYTGYWKIYDNLSDTLKLFEQFNRAKESMIRQVDAGASFSDIIRRSAV